MATSSYSRHDSHYVTHSTVSHEIIISTFYCFLNRNAPQHTATNRNTPQPTATNRNTPQHIETTTHRNTPKPQHTATHRDTPQHTATHHNTPQHTATHRNAPYFTHISSRDPPAQRSRVHRPRPSVLMELRGPRERLPALDVSPGEGGERE